MLSKEMNEMKGKIKQMYNNQYNNIAVIITNLFYLKIYWLIVQTWFSTLVNKGWVSIQIPDPIDLNSIPFSIFNSIKLNVF